MDNILIERAEEKDWPYIDEKMGKYLLDADNAKWEDFFVAKENNKTVAFGRIIDHGEYFEIASFGVDYYRRGRGIGVELLLFLIEKARKINPEKAIYGVTHRPGFLEKAGFCEILENIPEKLEIKRQTKCKDPSKIKIMKVG